MTTYWLYVSRKFVDAYEADNVIQAAERAQILEAFQASDEPRRVYLGSKGAREVDENFVK